MKNTLNDLVRKTKLSTFSNVFSREFKGKNVEDFKSKLDYTKNKMMRILTEEKEKIRKKNMEKLDKISERLVDVPIINQIIKPQLNIFEKLNKWQKEKIERKIAHINSKTRKKRLIDSSILLTKTPSNKENYSKQSPNTTLITAITTVGNKITSPKLRKDYVILQHKKYISHNNLPSYHKDRYKKLMKDSSKKLPISKMVKNDEKIILNKERIFNINKIDRLKAIIVLEKEKQTSIFENNESVSRERDRALKKIKGIGFDKYSKRKEIVSNSISNVLVYTEPAITGKNDYNMVNFNKMKDRFKVKKRLMMSPSVGSYYPKYECIEMKLGSVIPFGTTKVKKLPIQKIMSNYDVQIDYKTMKITESIKNL